MIRLLATFIFAGLLMVSAERASAQGKRVALVVGISSYTSAPKLPNAGNDANAMADLFRKAGFDVVTARSDVNNLEFKRTIREFEDSAADSDIAVVFYAGHGIQVRETNYLIPADAKLLNERDIEDEAISLDRLITAVEGAKRLRLIILDACRDNPFANNMRRRVVSRAAPSPGLGRIEPTMSDTLIAYAAKDGAVANDGDGTHSPYTTALLKNLTVPGLDIRLAFGRVRDDVMRATGRKQEPFVYGSLGGGTVALVPAPVEAAPAVQPGRAAAADMARTDYELVERVGKREAWEVFLDTHKTGLYAELARVQLAKLREADRGNLGDADRNVGSPRVNPSAPQPKRRCPPARRSDPKADPVQEQRAWDRLKTSTNQTAIRKFLDQFPVLPSPLRRRSGSTCSSSRPASGRKPSRPNARSRRSARRRPAPRLPRSPRSSARRKSIRRPVRLPQSSARPRSVLAPPRPSARRQRNSPPCASARPRSAPGPRHCSPASGRRPNAPRRSPSSLRPRRDRGPAEALARQREAEASLKAAEAERRKAETAPAAKERAQERAAAAEAMAKQRQAEENLKAADAERRRAERAAAANQRDVEEKTQRAETLKKQREAEDHAEAVAKKREAAERTKAERASAAKRAAEERMKSAAAEREDAEARASANRRKAADAEAQKAQRQAAAAAAAERRQRALEARAVAAPRPVAPRPVAAAPAPRGSVSTMVGVGF
jgi:hypothetical protein